MNEKQFIDIFINPLHGDKIYLSEIKKNIYDEILDLTNRFCIPNQILNNLDYDRNIENQLIAGLKKQSDLSNLKNLINQKDLLRITKVFNENGLEHVFLKGSAINVYVSNYVRHSRDIDVLVNKESLARAYELLKGIGFKYMNTLVSDNARFTNYKHHLPVLVNDEGTLVELHHRVTAIESYKDCPLTESILHKKINMQWHDVDIKVPDINNLIAHITYHAALLHNFNLGPVFLYDIKYLRNIVDNEKDLMSLLLKIDLHRDYKKIIRYIDVKNLSDTFNIYFKSNLKKHNRENPRTFNYFLFKREGRLEFLKLIPKKLKKNQDLYQTSKYSLKFYFILFIELKNRILNLPKH
tara:strand:+ start:2668 stop:3726 length:1059 start_codon:yes stop_codon:yes gene_type:complete